MKRLCILLTTFLAASPALAARDPVIIYSYLSEHPDVRFVYENLDLRTFRSSLNPSLSKEKYTFRKLGMPVGGVTMQQFSARDHDHTYTLRIADKRDRNGDGLEDIVLCFKDDGETDSRINQQVLLLSRFGWDEPIMALGYALPLAEC